MLHTATRLAAGVPPLCNPLLHCNYAAGAHISIFNLLVRFGIMATLIVGVPLVFKLSHRGPDAGWWRSTDPPPDDGGPPSPDGGTGGGGEASERSHRRRPRPGVARPTHGNRDGSRPTRRLPEPDFPSSRYR